MKVYVYLALVVSTVYSAPMMNSNWNGGNNNMSPEVKVKRFKAALYLFAPESWISSFNAISEAGQKCFLETANSPGAAKIYHSDDIDRMKKDLQTKCPTYASEYNSFIDITSQTVKSLPISFLQAMKDWEYEMQTIAKQVQEESANKGPPNGEHLKEYMNEFAKSTAVFTKKLISMSETERKQISTAFPRLQPFFTGNNAVEFLNRINEFYQNLASGKLDVPTLQTLGKDLKTTLQALFEQYSAINAEGIKKASELFGEDLMKIGALLKTQVNGQPSSNGFQLNSEQTRSEIANTITQKVQEEKIGALLQNAQQNGQEQFEKLKQNGQAQWQHFKDNLNSNPSGKVAVN